MRCPRHNLWAKQGASRPLLVRAIALMLLLAGAPGCRMFPDFTTLWRPPAPKGFSDDSAEWMPGLAERLDVANQLARRVGSLVEPDAVVDTALGPLASDETRQTVKRAESRPQALALLLMAPEFQRR